MTARSCDRPSRPRYTTAPRCQTRQAARGELARRVVDAVVGLLVLQPLRAVPGHAVLERRLRPRSRAAPGARVGSATAVADVAGAVLAVAHRLDVDVRARGDQRLRDLQHACVGRPVPRLIACPAARVGLERAAGSRARRR